MLGVVLGCAVIAVVVLVGYLLARQGVLGNDAPQVLNDVAFYAAIPAVTFIVISEADLRTMLSSGMVVAVISVLVCAIVYLIVALCVFRHRLAAATIGTASAVFVNSNNMGLPVAIYVVGDPTAIAAVLLLQPLVMSPVLIALLERSTRGRATFWSTVSRPLRNPVIPAAVLGLGVAVAGIEVPPVVSGPIEVLASASVPLVLIAFGASLRGVRVAGARASRWPVAVASVVKTVLMPVVAYVIAAVILRLPHDQVFAVTVVAALPTGQMVYAYATRFDIAADAARDVVLITTLGALPALIAIAAFLA